MVEQFFQQIFNALSLGSLYALIAIGYTMVYGILRLINFAHGDIFMLGGYLAFYAVTLFFMPWWVGFIVALGLTGIMGIGLERAAYRPLRNSPRISIMISAIGASFLLQSLATVIFGGRLKVPPTPEIFKKIVRIGSAVSDETAALASEAAMRASTLADEAVVIASELTDEAVVIASELTDEAAVLAAKLADEAATLAAKLADEASVIASEVAQVEASFGISVVSVSLFIPVITAILLIVLQTIVHKTKTGMAMRAVSTDLRAARLMAIDVNKIVSFTFGAGSVLAAIGGIMWTLKYPALIPTIGTMPGLKCFIAAVIGGIGNITGAVLGGILLGFIEIMMVAAVPALTGYRDAFAFVLLIVVLLVRPSGLLGKHQIEKV